MGIAAGVIVALMLQAGGGGRVVLDGGATQMPGQGVSLGATNTTSGATRADVDMRPLGENFDQAPQWIRRIDPIAAGRVYPAEAMRSGDDGRAEIKCLLTTDGALKNCSVLSETPGDRGFGRSTITLTSDLNLRPAMRGGRPVESEVAIAASFQGPGVPTGSKIAGILAPGMVQTIIDNPTWVRAPSVSEVVAAYPQAAKAADVSGRVGLLCVFAEDGRFRGPCQITNEEPAGYGFGVAAVSLGRLFQSEPELPDGSPVKNATYKLAVTFSNRLLDADPAAGEPNFLALPTPAEMQAAFPREALRRGVGSSRVTLECSVATGGVLAPCAVESESPTGLGFGQAALQVVPEFRMSQWSEDGLPVVGGTIHVPVGYDLTVRQAAR